MRRRSTCAARPTGCRWSTATSCGPTSCGRRAGPITAGSSIALGRWAEAEAELLAAIDGFDRGYRGDRGFAALRLADLRVRQGRVEEAERLLEGGEWHPTARRMAATIALVRGDTALASELGELCAEGSELADPTWAPALELLS